MIQSFHSNIAAESLQTGDCLIELPIDAELGDTFTIREKSIVTLGHHPGQQCSEFSSYQWTCAAWQAYLLAITQPHWQPFRILRAEWPVNLDDTLAALLVDPDTRHQVLALACFDRLLNEVAATDVLGPSGYLGLENRQNGRTLVNAINNRLSRPSLSSVAADSAVKRHAEIAKLILEADRLTAETIKQTPVSVTILRKSNSTVLAECEQPGSMAFLYSKGFSRVILIAPTGQDGSHRVTVGQNCSVFSDEKGQLQSLDKIDWSLVNTMEPGWGGRETIGGGPREGSRLGVDQLWELFSGDGL